MQKQWIFFYILFFVSSIALGQAPYNIVKVTADGYSYLGENDTIKQAKERAMKDAECKAIEQGTAIYLESYSQVNLNVLIEDEIKSLAAGYLTNKKVLIDLLESDPPRYHIQIEAEVKCADMDKLIKGRKKEENTKKQPFTIEFAVVAERELADGSWADVLVKDGGKLKSFDKFQIYFRPSADCYVYLLFYDSADRVSLLFPNKEMGMDNCVKKDTQVYAPGPNLFYELDMMIGIETIYLITSVRPMADVDWLLEKMEKAGSRTHHAAILENSIKARGIGRIAQGNKISFSLSDGKRVEKVTDVVMGKGEVVRKLSFEHY